MHRKKTHVFFSWKEHICHDYIGAKVLFTLVVAFGQEFEKYHISS